MMGKRDQKYDFETELKCVKTDRNTSDRMWAEKWVANICSKEM